MTRLIGDVAAGAQNVAGHIEETGGEVTFQGAAGLKTFGRAGLMVLSGVSPARVGARCRLGGGKRVGRGIGGRRHRRRRPADGHLRAVGRAHDAARHHALRRASFLAALRATRRDDRIFATMQTPGYGMTAAGISTAARAS